MRLTIVYIDFPATAIVVSNTPHPPPTHTASILIRERFSPCFQFDFQADSWNYGWDWKAVETPANCHRLLTGWAVALPVSPHAITNVHRNVWQSEKKCSSKYWFLATFKDCRQLRRIAECARGRERVLNHSLDVIWNNPFLSVLSTAA